MKVWVHSFFLCLIKGVVKLAHEFEVKKKKKDIENGNLESVYTDLKISTVQRLTRTNLTAKQNVTFF